MGKHARQFVKLGADFRKAGIKAEAPGFYDHPKYLEIERRRPEYLDNYARFVNWRPYDACYLDRAENVIRIVAEQLHAGLVTEGRLSGCIDTSITMNRILDRHGVWNYTVRGALRIIFPPETGRKPFCFWPVDLTDGTGGEYGHKWVYAPPFFVIDLTLRLQGYQDDTADFLPDLVLAKNPAGTSGNPDDILCPSAIEMAARMGQDAKRALASMVPKYVKQFAGDFPAYLVKQENVKLKYVPVAIGASQEPLEQIRSYSVKGRSASSFTSRRSSRSSAPLAFEAARTAR
jgi:hypothetical protein